MDYRSKIVYNLTMLKNKYNTSDRFKARAYNNALKQLTTQPIYSIKDVEGVGGEKTLKKMAYIIENNKDLEEVIEYTQNESYGILETLQKVHGIGPSKAKDLYENHNIRSLSDLEAKADTLLNNVQKTGLKYFNDINKRIPYKEMLQHAELVTKTARDPNTEISVVGSFRRKAKDSGDIDVLITGETNSLNHIINALIKKKYLVSEGVLAHGTVKFMGICKLPRHKTHRRIDILYTTPEEFPFAQLYFTGNDQFNIRMRKHALDNGYTLNEQGLFHTETKKRVDHPFKTEKDIFEFLKYDFVEPEERK